MVEKLHEAKDIGVIVSFPHHNNAKTSCTDDMVGLRSTHRIHQSPRLFRDPSSFPDNGMNLSLLNAIKRGLSPLALGVFAIDTGLDDMPHYLSEEVIFEDRND